MKGLFVVHALLIAVLIAAGTFLGEHIKEKDALRVEEKLRGLIAGEKYLQFPEVMALRVQSAPKQQISPPQPRDIQEEMTERLEGLEKEYTDKLEQLKRQAKLEYAEVKASKEKGSTDKFIRKYFQLLRGLEEECDVRVFAALLYYERELTSHGYDLLPVEQAREYYEQAKKQRRSELIK